MLSNFIKIKTIKIDELKIKIKPNERVDTSIFFICDTNHAFESYCIPFL